MFYNTNLYYQDICCNEISSCKDSILNCFYYTLDTKMSHYRTPSKQIT